MSKKISINYSVCNYMPSLIRKETIIFGIAIHCPALEFSHFYRTKNIERIKSFDDEYDSNYMHLMEKSFKYYFNYPALDLEEYDDTMFEYINEDSFISNITKYYVNEFHFTEVRKIESTLKNFQADIDDLKRTYLYYDRPKAERITTPEVKKLLNREIKKMKLNNYLNSSPITDLADRSIVDFEYGDTVVKSLSFDYKEKKYIVDQIKSFQADLIDNNKYFNNKNIKIIMSDSPHEDSIFVDKSIEKIKSLNENIEILNVGKYLESVFINGLK